MAAVKPLELTWPSLPYPDWEATKQTLHLFLQVVGKIRLKLHPKLNHWWHVTLYPTACGLSTHRIPYGADSFEIEFDFHDHALHIHSHTGERKSFPLQGLSVAQFYRKTLDTLAELGIQTSIYPHPYLHKSQIPFAKDNEHASYDAAAVERFWQILHQVATVLEEFRGRFLGKSTPVHVFWHGLDMALTRFSGKAAPPRTTGTKVDKEAYSHEVISFGFWPGDDNFPEPAFYSYTYPAPEGLDEQPLRPSTAFWADMNGSPYAFLKYEDLRTSTNPKEALMDFLESAYEAGSTLAHWPEALTTKS